MTIIQLFAFLFLSFAVSRAVLRAKDRSIGLGELFFWLAIWGGLFFVVFFPSITSHIARFVGIGRGIDVIVYTSIGLLFYMIFRMYVKIEELEMQLTKIVRDISIRRRK